MRLHPVEDGLIRFPDERTLTTHDRGGNRLRDVTDPETGMCTGVTSPLTIPDGTRVIHPTPVSGAKSASTPDVRFDPDREVYYDLVRNSDSDPFGLVIRTCDNADGPLPVTRVRVVSADVPKTGGKSGLPFTPISSRKENTAAVRAVLAGMGYAGPITPAIRKAALEMIAIEKSANGARGRTKGMPRDLSKAAQQLAKMSR